VQQQGVAIQSVGGFDGLGAVPRVDVIHDVDEVVLRVFV
jgi:hypothetical protein